MIFLSSLQNGQGNATFEAALDWLCLNLPGNELPLKFSSGVSSLASTGICNMTNELIACGVF